MPGEARLSGLAAPYNGSSHSPNMAGVLHLFNPSCAPNVAFDNVPVPAGEAGGEGEGAAAGGDGDEHAVRPLRAAGVERE